MIPKQELITQYIDLNKSQNKIGKLYNVSPSTIRNWLDKYSIPRKERNNKRKDITGKRFGRLIAIKRIQNYFKNYPYRSGWECVCDCGNITVVYINSLTRGLTTSCGCYQKEVVYKGYKELGGQQWSRIKHQAKLRNLTVTLTIQQAWYLYEKQNRKCALSGVSIELKANYKGKESNNTASLDRIDNSKGYSIDNVQWVHKTINIMRNKLTVNEFIDFCKEVTKYNE